MKNKNVSVIFKILPVALIIAGGFLFNVNAEDYVDDNALESASRMEGSIDISSSVGDGNSPFASYNAISDGVGGLYNQLQGFTVAGDKLVFYCIKDYEQTHDSIPEADVVGTLNGYTGTGFRTAINGSGSVRNYMHGNDMTYDTAINKVVMAGLYPARDLKYLDASTLEDQTTASSPKLVNRGAFAIGYDEADDSYVISSDKDSLARYWFVSKDDYTPRNDTMIDSQSGQHDGADNVNQGLEYHKGYIYSTAENWDHVLDGEVAYINVYKAKLKKDRKTPDKGYGEKVATYYVNAKDWGEVESISFSGSKAYLGFANGSTRNSVTKFARFNSSIIKQAFPAPKITYQDNVGSTSVIVTSKDTQLGDKSGWTRSEDGYSLTRTVNSDSISGSDVSICDRYGNCTDINYSHTNENYGTTYTLTFNNNGGEGTIEAQSCVATGSSCQVTVPSTKPTKTNHRFLGWANSDSATTASINPGDPVTLTKNKTVYAVWAPKYKLSFNLRDGTGTIETQVCYPQSTNGSCDVTVPMDEPTKDGFYFSGWVTADDSTNIIHGGKTLTLSSNLKLYAFWSPIYTVSFYKNDNVSTVPETKTCHPENKTSGSCEVDVPNPQPSRSGYFFLGWAGDAKQDHATKTGSKIAVTGSKDYYAIWAPIYILNYNLNGGTGSISSSTCHPNKTSGSCDIIISSVIPTKENYTFLGYGDDASATVALYHDGGNISISGNKTIYAVWSNSTPTPEPEPEGTGEISWVQEQEHTRGDTSNAVFRIDYPKSKFLSLMVDNETVPIEYYGVENGSTVITISYDYLDTLSAGEHTVAANFEDNITVTTTFTIAEAPVDPDDPDDPVTPDDPDDPDDPSDDEDVLAPDTSMVNGSDEGSYGGYLIGASIIVAISVVTANIIRRVKTNRRIQFK